MDKVHGPGSIIFTIQSLILIWILLDMLISSSEAYLEHCQIFTIGCFSKNTGKAPSQIFDRILNAPQFMVFEQINKDLEKSFL